MPKTLAFLFAHTLTALFLLFAAPLSAQQAPNLPLDKIRLPSGFHIELWARVDNARAMTLGSDNTVFVGSMRAGKVVAVKYDKNFRATNQYVIAEDLSLPVGVAFHKGALYVSAVERILRFDNIEKNLAKPPSAVVVSDRFPKGGVDHSWKFIAFGPDDKLYVPVGAPCNICEPDTNKYANIMRMNADGSKLEVFARGVRNSVGFDWHPKTRELWFTDNGRDWLGDDSPPCELNHAPKAEMHFGYPYCHGGTIADPDFGDKSGNKRACKEFTPPVQNLGPHVAPLGMRFYTGTQFPAEYRDQIFIAEHGSWNRAQKIGYRVMLVRLKDNRAVSYTPFAEGWLQGQSAFGRPVDVQMLPDGSLLISDDLAGAIYRVSYRK